MTSRETLLLSRSDVSSLLTLGDCITAVESAFRGLGEGRTPSPAILGLPARGGGFHIKAALLPLVTSYFAAKVNGNFFHNARRFGMPNIQGLILLCNAENGQPLAVMDSIEITILRTGAATAIAAKYLARAGSKVVTICGCGSQGGIQLRALAQVLPLECAFAFDVEGDRAESFARLLSGELKIKVSAAEDLGHALSLSDVCVTCTSARTPLMPREQIRPGTFVAAVGADSPEKQELDPALVATSKLVVDALSQCSEIGELHHALDDGLIRREQVHAELAELVAGRKLGRTSEEEITVFDSTGTALEDAAAAAEVYERALLAGGGQVFLFSQ